MEDVGGKVGMKRGSWWADGGGEVIRRTAPADEKRGEMKKEVR